MATLDGTWLPGIGDPTPVGWLTVAAYFGAAWVCWQASAPDRGARAAAPITRRRFWWVLTLAMAFLGVNKQLDLQTAVTEIGRAVAQQGGWYEQRHKVQMAFIGLVGIAGVLSLGVLGWLSWPLSRGRALGLGGLVFLGTFIVIRAASFHHVDLLINDSFFGLRWNWIFELSGIALVAAGAVLERRARLGGAPPFVPSTLTPNTSPTTAPTRAPRPRRPAGDDRPVV